MAKVISILRLFRKELNKSASELTYEEKLEVLSKIMIKARITKKIDPRIYEILSSMTFEEGNEIEQELRFYMYGLPFEEQDKLAKYLDLNFISFEDTFGLLLHSGVMNAKGYKHELLNKIYKNLTKLELKAVLKKLNAEETTKFILHILDDETYLDIIKEFKDKIYIKKEELAEAMNIIVKAPKEIKYAILFNKNNTFRILFEPENEKYLNYFSKVEIDCLKHFLGIEYITLVEDKDYLQQLNTILEMLAVSNIEIIKHYDLTKNNTVEELRRIRVLLDNSSYLANQLDSILSVYNTEYRDLRKELEPLTLEEQKEYFINTSLTSNDLYYFEDIVELLTKDQIIKKIQNMKLYSLPSLITKKFTEDEIVELFEQYPNIFDDYVITNFCLSATGENIKRCLNVRPNLGAMCIRELLSYSQVRTRKEHVGAFFDSKEIEVPCHIYEVKDELYAYIERLLQSNTKVFQNDYIYIDHLQLSELKRIKEKNPNFYKMISFHFSSIELIELIKYFDSFIDDKSYLSAVFYAESSNQEEKEYQLQAAYYLFCIEEEENYYKLFERISENSYKNIFNKLNEERKVLFIKHIPLRDEKPQDDKLKPYLLSLSRGQEIYELYNSINETNRSKLEKKEKNYDTVSYHKSKFIQNIDCIVNNVNTLKELIQSNPTVFFTINYDYLYIFDGKDLDFFTRYKKTLYDLTDENKRIFKRIIKRVKEQTIYPESIIDICIQSTKMLKDLDDLSEQDLDKLIYYMVTNQELFNSYISVKEILDNMEESQIELSERLIKDENSTLDDIKNAILTRYLHINVYKAKNLVYEYKSSLNELISNYENKDLSEEEKKEYRTLLYFQQIKTIIETEDKELLVMLYNNLSSKTELEIVPINYIDLLMLEQYLKTIYTKELKGNLYKPTPTELKGNINYEGTNIEVYEPKDQFNILLTVVGAYVKNKDAKANPEKSWNDENKKTNHGICTSLIANDNLSMAMFDTEPLILGFYNIEDASIQKAANYDISSWSNNVQITAMRLSNFRTTRNMIDNIRHGHSEYVLERRKGTTESIEKRQPDFVVAIEPISKLAKKAAVEFNIPIVLLDINKIAKREHDKLISLKEQLLVEMNEEVLAKFITVYHNNYAGCISNFKKVCKTNFNPKEFKKYFMELVKAILQIENDEQRIHYASAYLRFLLEEEEKRKRVSSEYLPFDFKDIKYQLELIINSKTLDNPNTELGVKK